MNDTNDRPQGPARLVLPIMDLKPENTGSLDPVRRRALRNPERMGGSFLHMMSIIEAAEKTIDAETIGVLGALKAAHETHRARSPVDRAILAINLNNILDEACQGSLSRERIAVTAGLGQGQQALKALYTFTLKNQLPQEAQARALLHLTAAISARMGRRNLEELEAAAILMNPRFEGADWHRYADWHPMRIAMDMCGIQHDPVFEDFMRNLEEEQPRVSRLSQGLIQYLEIAVTALELSDLKWTAKEVVRRLFDLTSWMSLEGSVAQLQVRHIRPNGKFVRNAEILSRADNASRAAKVTYDWAREITSVMTRQAKWLGDESGLHHVPKELWSNDVPYLVPVAEISSDIPSLGIKPLNTVSVGYDVRGGKLVPVIVMHRVRDGWDPALPTSITSQNPDRVRIVVEPDTIRWMASTQGNPADPWKRLEGPTLAQDKTVGAALERILLYGLEKFEERILRYATRLRDEALARRQREEENLSKRWEGLKSRY